MTSEAPIHSENFKSMNILLVDDRPENLLVLEELLEKKGRTFIKASSGIHAMKLLLQYQVGLILLDVQMPDMDGFEVASLLKANPTTREIPIVFITALNKEEKYILRGFEGGAIDYLYKPLNAEITQAKINVFEDLYHQQQALKDANVRLTKMNQQLEDLNMQKNYLLGMAAHDLRNPIGVIYQLSDLLLSDIGEQLDEEQLKFLNSILQSSQYMLQIIEDLLDISKIEAGKMSLNIQATDMGQFLAGIVGINQLIANRKGIRITLKAAVPSSYLYIDPVKLEQVINNLVSNAIKYSPSNTVILLEAEEKDDALGIRVIDQGQGIPPEEQHKLFRGFQTTSVKATGGEKSTGLGLLICSRIIQAHGGEIYVRSEVNKGSVFGFTIPITIAENEAQERFDPIKITETEMMEPAVVLSGMANRHKTILVAEDDKIAQIVVKTLLSKLGYDTLLANDGKEVMSILMKNEVRMVLMDVHMPGTDGIEATRQIRNTLDPRIRNLPIIGLTASSIDTEIEACLVAGMNICIKKPVIISELMKTLQKGF